MVDYITEIALFIQKIKCLIYHIAGNRNEASKHGRVALGLNIAGTVVGVLMWIVIIIIIAVVASAVSTVPSSVQSLSSLTSLG